MRLGLSILQHSGLEYKLLLLHFCVQEVVELLLFYHVCSDVLYIAACVSGETRPAVS